VEGVGRLLHDVLKSAIEVPDHIRGGQMEDAIAPVAQISVAFVIPDWTITIVVGAAVDFDYHTRIANEEIRRIGADRVLTPDLEA
jgi:hypothetical protein